MSKLPSLQVVIPQEALNDLAKLNKHLSRVIPEPFFVITESQFEKPVEFRVRMNGQPAIVDVVITSAENWLMRPEASSPFWSSREIDGVVIAVHCLT